MNSAQAIVNTGAASFGVAQTSDILQWMLNGFPHPVPDNVTMALAAILLPLGHMLYAWLANRSKVVVPPATPVTKPQA